MTWHICCDEGEWEPIFWRSFGFGWFFCYDDYFKAFGRQVVYIGIPTKNNYMTLYTGIVIKAQEN